MSDAGKKEEEYVDYDEDVSNEVADTKTQDVKKYVNFTALFTAAALDETSTEQLQNTTCAKRNRSLRSQETT